MRLLSEWALNLERDEGVVLLGLTVLAPEVASDVSGGVVHEGYPHDHAELGRGGRDTPYNRRCALGGSPYATGLSSAGSGRDVAGDDIGLLHHRERNLGPFADRRAGAGLLRRDHVLALDELALALAGIGCVRRVGSRGSG